LRWGFMNYRSLLALSCGPPDLSLPSSLDYGREPWVPGHK
jgi:hypothetical protein